MTEQLTEEQLREIKARCEVANKMGAISPVPRWQIEAMATELIALRAERAKLEGALRKARSSLLEHEAIGGAIRTIDAALAQPAGGGATERWWDTGGREHLPRAGAKP